MLKLSQRARHAVTGLSRQTLNYHFNTPSGRQQEASVYAEIPVVVFEHANCVVSTPSLPSFCILPTICFLYRNCNRKLTLMVLLQAPLTRIRSPMGIGRGSKGWRKENSISSPTGLIGRFQSLHLCRKSHLCTRYAERLPVLCARSKKGYLNR